MILVTGGTGLVGAHLLYHLLQEHDKVRATHRKSSCLDSVKEVFSFYTSNAQSWFDRVEWIEADITDVTALNLAFDGISEVYHCAAFISFNPKHFPALVKTNIEGTANVVNLCLRHKVIKLCHVSSISTLGKSENGAPINESCYWNPEAKNSVYAISKYGAEMEVWRGTQEGLNAVIVNPGVILGEGFWNSGSGVIFKRSSKGSSYYTKGATGFVDVKDVARMMIRLMKEARFNEQYILVAENLSFQELLTQLALSFGNAVPDKALPRWVMTILRYLDGISGLLFKTKRSLLSATVRSMYTYSEYDASKIKEALSDSFMPIEETIKRVAKQYAR